MKITMKHLQSRIEALNAALGTDYELDYAREYAGYWPSDK